MNKKPYYLSLLLCSVFLSSCGPKLSYENLLSDDPLVREKVLTQLKNASDKKQKNLISPLFNALQSTDSIIINRATDAIAVMGIHVLPELKASIQNPDAFIRASAADLIGNLGEQGQEATPLLMTAVTDPHPLVKEAAIIAIGKMGPSRETAIPTLIKALSDNSEEVSVAARDVLTKIGTPEALAALKVKPNKKKTYSS